MEIWDKKTSRAHLPLGKYMVNPQNQLSKPSGNNGSLYLADCLGNLDFTRAAFGAVENRMAAVHAELVIQDPESFSSGSIAAVENEAVGSYDSLWSHILVAGPKYRTGGGAAGAQDTLGRIIKAFALIDTLQTFLRRWWLIVDKIRFHRPKMFKEFVHVHDQILDYPQTKNGFDGDLVGVEIF